MSAARTESPRAFSPATLTEAVRVLRRHPEAVPMAGCTDLMVRPPEDLVEMGPFLDLTRIRALRGIRREEEGLRIGAAVTFTRIGRSRRVRAAYPILAEAASSIGSWQIRNRATLGGNMANASPAGDSLPVLLALDAVVVTVGPRGRREVPYARFNLDYRQVDLAPGEIIGWVKLPAPAANAVQRFRKVGTREAQAISKVVVAMSAERNGEGLRNVRFGAGSVAPTPVRLREVEAACEGGRPGPELADRAAEAAMDSVHPIDDVRSTAEYRRAILGRVVRRMILSCGQGATS